MPGLFAPDVPVCRAVAMVAAASLSRFRWCGAVVSISVIGPGRWKPALPRAGLSGCFHGAREGAGNAWHRLRRNPSQQKRHPVLPAGHEDAGRPLLAAGKPAGIRLLACQPADGPQGTLSPLSLPGSSPISPQRISIVSMPTTGMSSGCATWPACSLPATAERNMVGGLPVQRAQAHGPESGRQW